jgi:hypothetical protein
MIRTNRSAKGILSLCLPAIAAAAALLSCSVARAQILITVSAENVTAAAGSTGDALDITLTNGGPGSVTIGAFAFEVTVPSTDITLTGVTTGTTAVYVFSGESLFGPGIGIPVSGQDMMASDVSSGAGTTVGSGATVGLGHLVFDVAGSASGVYPVSLVAFPATSLSDPNSGNIDITILNNGSITVTGGRSNVPEPGSLALLGGLVAPGGLLLRRRRR